MGRMFFAAMVIGGLVLSSVCFGYSGGSGTPAAPYQIATKTDLLALAVTTADYNKCFILTADINMGGQVFTTAIIAADTSSGSGFQGTAFTGTFDGNGLKITNFTINGGSNDFLGLFGYISSGGAVKNLGLEDFAVSGSFGSQYVGGLVGWNYGGSISNCHSTGAVSGSYCVGGLVGWNSGSISNCYSRGDVAGGDYSTYLGGLVGCNGNGGVISNCYSTGTVTGGYNSIYVGGLVGYNDGSISDCYSTGTVSGSSGSQYVGGLLGYKNGGSISNCYSTGAVNGYDYVGGLVGENYEGSISNCYSTGAVSGTSYVGGLVGVNGGSVFSSFWDTQTSGQSTSVGGEGKTTAEMQTLSTFVRAGWDFGTPIWVYYTNGYPRLAWEPTLPTGDLNHDKVVNFLDFAILANNWLEEESYHGYQEYNTLIINIEGNGSVSKDPDQATYLYGDVVELAATPDTGWTFDSWSGDLSGSDNPKMITMTGNKAVTATFTRYQYTLTINTVGNGTVAKDPDQATYHYGDVVGLTATAYPGHSFIAWSGDLKSSDNPEWIYIDKNENVTATFTP